MILAAITPWSNTSWAGASPPNPLGKVSFEWIDNRIFVPVTINGVGPFHLILDTGANLAVSPELARKAGLKAEASGEASGVGEHTIPSQSTHVRTLSFGPVRLENLDADILSTADSSNVFGRIPVDGYFGLEVFQKYVVQHDYLNRELTIYDPATYSYNGPGESFPFQRNGIIPVIHASFDGIEGEFGVDTGARSALILYGPFVTEHQLVEKYQPKIQGVSGWGIGGPVRSYMVRSHSLRFGSFELRHLIARLSLNKAGATARSGKAGLIGPDVLKQFTFTCDYRRGRLIFEKNANFGLRDSYDRAGIWLSQKGAAFEVFDVIPGGPAAIAGLQVGDTVVAIDGTDTAHLALTDVRDHWKAAAPGTVVKLKLSTKAGTTRDVTLVLRDLV